MVRILRLSLIAFVSLWIIGCGQKGPLKLPEAPAKEAR
jgi:predicted small lipoprotein YifL